MMDLNTVLAVISLAMNVIVTIALFYIGSKTNKIDSLERRLEEASSKRMDEKISAMQQQCHVRHANLDDRLKSGDRHFTESREAEKEMAKDIADIRENMATRGDLKDLSRKIDEMRV